MTEASPLILPTLTIDHHDERRRRQRNGNGIDVNDVIAAADRQPAPSRSQQQSSLPLTTQSMQQQAISTSILPVIDEGVGSGDDSISSHSAGSIRGHWNPLLLGDSRSHCVVWPPRGYAAWPPPSDSEDDDEGSMFGQYLPTTIYGSLPLSNQLHRDGENNITDTPPLIRPLPAISSGVRILANRQEVSGSQQQQQQQPRNILRSLLIVRLAFSLLAMIVWLSVLSQAPDDSYTDTTVSDFAYSADEPWGGFEQRSTNNSDGDDDDDDDGKPKHYASSSLLSTLPYYRRNYDEYERGGEGGFIEYARNSNDDGNNGTILAEIDNDLEGIEEGGSNSHQEYGIDPIIQTDVSTSLPSDITFADLAGMMLPSYFQRTVRLCISTIKPAIINHTTIEDNVTVTTPTKTTSVSPGDVFKLRKTMLKTRDMLDAFSPVFSTQSSLDDYDRKKYGELILKFKPWKNVKLEGERMLVESNYLTGDTNVIINAEQQNGRTSRRLPTQHGGKYIFKDLWYTLRRFLDRGYTLIGDFQDLDHAKIMVSPAQLAQYQHQVWDWTDEFMTFVTKNRHHVSLYLSLPCKLRKKKQQHNCRYVHSHSSHLFWGAVHSERDLPNGNKDKATYVLGRLGYMQLGRAKAYLVDVLAREHVISTNDYLSTNATTSATSLGDGAEDKIDFNDEDKDRENEVHEIYHNLRKELRSLLDELDLFGDLLLPQTSIVPEIFSNKFTVSEDQTDSMSSSATPRPQTSSIPSTPSVQNQTDEAVEVLRSVRNMLGDLNDSFVAYAKYLEWNEYLDKRLELQNDVETQWGTFRAWANEVDLIAKLNFLMGEIEPPLQFHSAGGGIRE
jgi:hypothetical protein